MTRPKSLTLKITQDVIDEATSQNSARCMIAQAIRWPVDAAPMLLPTPSASISATTATSIPCLRRWR